MKKKKKRQFKFRSSYIHSHFEVTDILERNPTDKVEKIRDSAESSRGYIILLFHIMTMITTEFIQQ